VSTNDYTPLFQSAGQTFNVDPLLAQAVAQVESGYDPNATSKDSQGSPVAYGVMQVTQPNLSRLNVRDPYNPEYNIPAGTRMLDEALTAANGNVPLALRIYEGGPDQSKWGPQNAAYPAKVAAAYQKLTRQAPAPAANGDALDDFLQGKTSLPAPTAPSGQPQAAGGATPGAPTTPDALDAVLGGGSAPAWAQSPPAPTPPQPAHIDPITGYPIDDQGQPVPGQGTMLAGKDQGTLIPGNTPTIPTTIDQARAMLAEKPGYTSGGILPIRVKNGPDGKPDPSLGVELDWGPLRPLGEGALDLLQGTETGQVTPAATNVLMGAAMGGGLTPSIARGTGQAIADTAMYGRSLADLYAARPPAIDRGVPVGNPLAATPPAPSSPAVNPLSGRAAPSFVPPGANVPVARNLDDVVNLLMNLPDAPPRPSFLPPGTPRPGAALDPAFARNPLAVSPGVEAGPRNALMPESPQAVTATPPVSPRAPAPVTVNPTSTAPVTAPQPVGAAASTATEANMTPAQVQAYRSTAEGQKLLESQPVGSDLNRYVPGVEPNQAEIEQSVNTSRELKSLQQTAPEVSEEAKAIANGNNEARKTYFANVAGSDVDIMNAKAARAAQAERDLQAAWQNKTDADVQPIFDVAAQIKASPDGRRPLVRNAVDAVTSELQDSDGNPITDPEQLYGVRKHIDDLMSKEAAAADAKNIRAASNLQTLKDALDGVIEQAAPGFGQYLQNFSEASRPIDTMQALQGFENKLYDTQGRMQLSRVQQMMRNIVDARAAPGINPFKSIPDETMQRLWNLRDDLRRSASAQELARTPGSDTAQNLFDIMRGAAHGVAGHMVAHGAANALAPGWGSVGLAIAKNAIAPARAAKLAKKQTARGLEMLHPSQEKFPARNPLEP
jgi:hypothetical protein